MTLSDDSQNISKISEMNESVAVSSYTKLKNIETTAFSKVFAASHTPTNNLVALKFIESTFVKDPVKVKQYIKESVAAGRLQHANIAKVYESGKLGNLDYFSMEFLYGKNLKSILDNVKILSPYLATEIILKVALALEYANENALIHKGIRLENIFIIDVTKNIKLQGFGLAHGVRSDDPEFQEILIDSLKYASPEQAAEKAIDFRSDIYSLGVCYYNLVTGRFPFESENPEELISMHTNDDIPEPSSIRFELDKDIDSTIVKMLGKKPEDRFDSYSSLIAELVKILDIDDVASYLAQSNQAQEAIAVQAPLPVETIMPPPRMIENSGFGASDNKQLVDIKDDEIEEIEDVDVDEIEEIEDVDEIEEVDSELKIPLRMAPKKLKAKKNTDSPHDAKRKPTQALKKAPKTRRQIEGDRNTPQPGKRVKPKTERSEKPRRRRPEEAEPQGKRPMKRPITKKHPNLIPNTPMKKPPTKQLQKSQIPTQAPKPAPKPVAKPAPTPAVKPAPKPIQAPPTASTNPEPQKIDNEEVIFPDILEETAIPISTNENMYSSEILESKTSSGKVSKAPKVPMDGGAKIRLNQGALQLDSSSKLSDIDAQNNASKAEDEEEEIMEDVADFEEIMEDVADFTEIEIIDEDESENQIK